MAPIQSIVPALSNHTIHQFMSSSYSADCPAITNNAVKLRKAHNVMVRVQGSLAVYTCLKNYNHEKGDMLRWCFHNQWRGQEPSCKVDLFHSKTFLVALILTTVCLMAFPILCVDFCLKVRRSTHCRNINDSRLLKTHRLYPERILPDEEECEKHVLDVIDNDKTRISKAGVTGAIITLLDWVRENPKTPHLTTVALKDLQNSLNNRGVD